MSISTRDGRNQEYSQLNEWEDEFKEINERKMGKKNIIIINIPDNKSNDEDKTVWVL